MRNLISIFALAFLFASCAKPIANFTYQKEEKKPSNIKFENQSKKATEYEWQFGDGNSSKEVSPNHNYAKSGEYKVSLKATKGKKEVVTEKTIMVEKLPEVVTKKTTPVQEEKQKCLIVLETDFGEMEILLYNETPQHQDNFLKLIEEQFFDGLLFHRVIEGFMIQGGDPKSKNAKKGMALGSGGPGYTVPAEFSEDLAHVKGALSAARTGDNVNPQKRSSGSQFYIVQGRPVDDAQLNMMEARKGIKYTPEQREAYKTIGGTPFLDQDYTVFGQVVKGLDVIDKIAAVQKDGRDRPVDDVTMKIKLKNNN